LNYFIAIQDNILLLGGLLKKVEIELQTYAKELGKKFTEVVENYFIY